LKQDFGQLNEDRLYGKLAPMKPPCEARKSILLYDLTSTK
jgi:hypothetical protein